VVKLVVLDVVKKPPLIVPPTSLKKFVTGRGNAKKNEMLLGVYKQWGVEFSDDNQADAFALEKFGLAYLGATLELHKYQIEAIEAVRKGK
jgi:crossover junction endodeoxyribonuclease RuvC